MSSERNKESVKEVENHVSEKDIREIFDLFDKNKDESLSASELEQSLRSLGFRLNYKELQKAFKSIDTNRNGKIEFKEFRDYIMEQVKKNGNNTEEHIRQVFQLFDKDGNGYIERRELRRAMRSLGETLTDEELDQMMEEADDNSDGVIDYEEFVVLMKHKLSD